MPGLTRLFVKTSLVYLVLALGAGALLLAGEAVGAPAALARLEPVYVHLFMVGWVTQLIFGVAWWLFPAASRGRPRGDERVVALAYAALNAGLGLRAVVEPLHAARPGTIPAAALVVSALLQAAGGWACAAQLWPRVRGRAGAAPDGGKGS